MLFLGLYNKLYYILELFINKTSLNIYFMGGGFMCVIN